MTLNRLLRTLPSPPGITVVAALAVSALVATPAASAAGAAGPAAAAPAAIEGIWSFEGGQVAIMQAAGGDLEGVVVAPTKFAECTHKAGELMWSDMALQPDGSYWGLHRWFFDESCLPNPTPGPTAWRVLQNAAGSRYLEVCFSEPGQSQPTIAANGTSTNSTFGCRRSLPTGPLPVVSTSGKDHAGKPGSAPSTPGGAEQIAFHTTLVLPKTATCTREGSLKIGVRDPRYDPLRRAVVWVQGKRAAEVRGVGALKRGIRLGHLPAGSYTVRVLAVTVLNQRLTGQLKYHSCGKHSVSSIIKLHGSSQRHH